jgi:hypothetical protein
MFREILLARMDVRGQNERERYFEMPEKMCRRQGWAVM